MKRLFIASSLALSATYGVAAHAQEAKQPSYFEREMAAPKQAFELGVSAMYNQGAGNLTDTASPAAATTGRRVQDAAGAGVGAEIDLGYRFIPEFAAGVFVSGSEYNREVQPTGTNVRSLTAGLQGQWFFRPYTTVNPWVGLASAYRGHWIVPDVGGTTARHGWEVARLQVGLDLRASKEVSLGPYIGGGVDVFFSETTPGTTARTLDGPPAAGFFGAGLLGRFDLGGTYTQAATLVSRR
jgi:hypothetical protein